MHIRSIINQIHSGYIHFVKGITEFTHTSDCGSPLQMAEVAHWCLSEEATDRPEMREVVVALSRIRMSSIEWEASLGGSSQIFSGVFSGR